MKYIDKIDVKWLVIVFLLSAMYWGYNEVQTKYVEVHTTTEGTFILKDGHLFEVKLLDLYQTAE